MFCKLSETRYHRVERQYYIESPGLQNCSTGQSSEQHQTALQLETKKLCSIAEAFNERTPVSLKESEAVVCANKLLHLHLKHNIPHITFFKDLVNFAISEMKIPVLQHLNKAKYANYTSHHTIDKLIDTMTNRWVFSNLLKYTNDKQ